MALQVADAVPQPTATGGCWYRYSGNQPMRNAAIADAQVAAGTIDAATVAVCAPSAHKVIWRRWNETKTTLGSAPRGVPHSPTLPPTRSPRCTLTSCSVPVPAHRRLTPTPRGSP